MRPPDTAERLRDAAFDLFSTQGFEATTVDDIAQRAAVGRTTFFRHFRTKEDVVFPDHAGLVAAVRTRLRASREERESPLHAVTEAALVVLRRYVDEGERARARYRLVTSVEPLRARELASALPYQRAFGGYLRRVLPEGPQSRLYAEVLAAAVIAAHNVVLRRWLRGESDDPGNELREALSEVFGRWWEPVAQDAAHRGSTVVVLNSVLSATDAASVVRQALSEHDRTARRSGETG
jgi:AcrR family transcriptional regulator